MNSLKWIFLVFLGLAAGLVLVFPSLVVVGLIFLIIPGLILYAIPNIFVYLLATFSIRAVLPLRSEFGAHLVAFSLTLGLSAAIMHGYRVPEIRRFEQAAIPEIEPPQKLTLAGDIFLHWPDEDYRPNGQVDCDFLCTALLDTPGVTSVTRTCQAGSATFRLGPGNPGTPVMPIKPEKILQFQALDRRQGIGQDRHDLDERSLRAAWALRFASGEELKRDQPLRAEDAEWTIEFVMQRKKGLPTIERLEIRDKDGTVMVRKLLVQHDVPAPLFFFGFDIGSSLDGFAHSRFMLGSFMFSHGTRFFSLEKENQLLRLTNIAFPALPKDHFARVEKMVDGVLDNPNATESQLLVVPTWISSLPRNAKGDRNDLFARILLDERIADPGQLLRRVIPDNTDLTPLREGLAKRYLNAAETDAKSWYLEKLVCLPDGTFEWPSDDERAILNEAVMLQGLASPFVERMADQGPQVIPELLSLMEATRNEASGGRRNLWEGIRNAFNRLGPDAAPAAPRILSMIHGRSKDFLNEHDDMIGWLVTLRLIGVEETELQRILIRESIENIDRILEIVNKNVQEHLQKR
ncbi:MAG: hypothetical protein ACK5YR_01130 [Pirellula sp.]